MALTADRRIGSKHFSGQAKLQDAKGDSLSAIVRGMLIREARILSAAATYPSAGTITDSTGGAKGILFTGATTDIVTLVAVAAESFKTGDGPFQLTTSNALPAGLAASTNYWVRRISAQTYKLYSTKAKALDPTKTAVDITDTGTGTHYVQCIGRPTDIVTDDGFDDTDSFTAVTGDTSFDTIMDNYAEILDVIDAILVIIGAGTVDDGPGSVGAAGTIAAVDIDVAANSSNTTGVTFGSALAIVAEIENSQLTVLDAVNRLAVAIGITPIAIARNVRGTIDPDGVNGGDAITNCVTTTATTILASATAAGIEIWLAGMADNNSLIAVFLQTLADASALGVLTNYAGE